MPDKKISDLVDGGSPQNTDEFVVARAGDNFKLAWSSLSSSQSVQTQNAVDVTLSGNTSGALALVSSGTLSLAGGNNITLSQAGNAVTISGAAIPAESQTFIAAISASDTLYTSGSVRFTGSQAATVRSGTGQLVVIDVPAQTTQVETQTFIGGVSASDTLYTSGTVRITGVGGGITVSSNTGQRIDLSVAAQSVQPETQTFIGGISASNTLYTSGSVRFTGSQAVTVRSGTGQLVVIDVPAQTTQVETQTFIGGISASDTLYTSGSVRFTGSNAVTVKSGTGQLVVIDVPVQTAQTFVGGVAASNTTYTSGTVTITGVGGGVTVSSNTGQRVDISVAAQSAQTQGILAVGASTGGNTAGDTGVASGTRLVFVGSNNLTVSQGTAANATTLTLSGPATHAVQTGISAISNSNTTYTSGTVGFSELGAITIRSTTGQAFQFSVNSQTAQTQGILNAGVSTGGNTSGNTQVSSGTRLVFVGSNNITLSQGTAADATTITVSALASSSLSATGQVSISTNASTISIGVPNPIQSFYRPINPLLMGATQGIGASAATRTTVTAWVMPMSFPNDLAFNNINLAAHCSFSSATTSISSVNYSFSMGASLGFYTLNASTLSRVTSFSGSLGYSNATAAAVGNMSLTARVGMGGSSTTKSTQGGANMSAIMSSIDSVRQVPLNWSTISHTLTRGNYFAVACFTALTGGANQASLSQVGFESNMSILGSAFNPPELMQNTASVTSPFPFMGLATIVNSSNSFMPDTIDVAAITKSTAIANSTNFQSLWMRIYSSHQN